MKIINVKLFLFWVLSLFTFSVDGQVQLDSSKRFIVEFTPKVANIRKLPEISAVSVSQVNVSIIYLDGLGRAAQTVQWQGSPEGQDIVQHIEYDQYGRQSRSYLPYVSSSLANGSYRMGGNAPVHAFYSDPSVTDIARTARPYAETILENSPLNRIKEQGSVGDVWQPHDPSIAGSGHTVKMDYGTNTASGADVVRLWRMDATGHGASATGNYAAGRLHRNTVRDENWTSGRVGTVDEYTNLEGRVVLRRVWESESSALDTYSVYDVFGQLRYVIPPGYTETVITDGSASFDNYLHAYRYDGRRRLTEKKLPGKGWEYLVYNKADQLVLTQDAVQRTQKQWSYVRYDHLGRAVISGLYTNTVDTSALQIRTLVSGFTGPLWEDRRGAADYSGTTFPVAGTGITILPLAVSYYDDYAFSGAASLPEQEGSVRSPLTQTLLTGYRVYKDDGTSPLLTVSYYDDKGRVVQSAAQNHLGGTDYVTSTYSFVGELLSSKRTHRAAPTGATTTIIAGNTYDHVGRLLTTTHKINGQDEVTLVSNNYNELGQLKGKSVGGSGQQSDFHTSTTYSHNERGWLTSASSPHFSYGLNYQNTTQGAATQYNGNISEQQWTHYGQTGANHFTYSYDKLNRLIDGNSLSCNMREQLEYDVMGNITKLIRDNHATGTAYSYIGNRLKSLSGAISTPADYLYDANGNATKDRMGMNFRYNHLNLPDSVWSGGVQVGYLYDAMGNKLRKYTNQGSRRDYVGGIEYSAGTIELIHTGEGVAYRNLSDGTYTYRYNMTDHLGNVRATLYRNPVTGAVEVLQKDDYYPFGKQYVVQGGDNNYLYNGKELQDELGGQYDYGARYYDAEIGRWNVVDPLADSYHSFSPYNYALNDPIGKLDPNGMWVSTLSGYTTSDFGDISAFMNHLRNNGTSMDGMSQHIEDRPTFSIGLEEIVVTRDEFFRGDWLASVQNRVDYYSSNIDDLLAAQRRRRALAWWPTERDPMYGPWVPDATGFTVGVNAFGLTYGMSVAFDKYHNFRWYTSGTASLGVPMFPTTGLNFSIDLYENTSATNNVLDEIEGLTFDTSIGTGTGGVTYSRPINRKGKTILGAHKISIGYGTGIGVGLDATKPW